MSGACEVDYVEFPSIDNVSSRQFFSAAFCWTSVGFILSCDEIRGAGLLARVESGEAVKSAGSLAVIHTTDFKAAKCAVIVAGGTSTLPLKVPGGQRFHFPEPGARDE